MLTTTQCRNAKPKQRPYKLTDGKGLYLEVKPTRVKAWRYRFELCREGERKESVFAIGHYATAPTGETEQQAKARRASGGFTLAEAREERAKARALVRQGINPARQRRIDRVQREREYTTTFEAVTAEWLALRDWEESTKARRLRMLARVVFPKLGALPVKRITPALVLDVLETAAKNNGPTVAAEAKRTMSGVFDLAVSTLRADADPVYPVRKALPAYKTHHKRPLTAEEVGQFLRDLIGYEHNFQTVAAFRLMWLTLCRSIEIVGARWEEFDLEAAEWRIPAERMKKRKEHVVPLPTQGVDLLRTVQGFTGHRWYVFPNRENRDKPMSHATLRLAVACLGWSGRYSPHATRTTGSTHLNQIGYPADWIERQLAHVEPNAVRRTYNHADYLTDRAKMMQAWADYLDGLTNGAEVVPLRSVGSR